MPFSLAEREAIQRYPLGDICEPVQKLIKLLREKKEWQDECGRFLLSHFVLNQASNVIFTNRRDCRVGNALFPITRNMDLLETIESKRCFEDMVIRLSCFGEDDLVAWKAVLDWIDKVTLTDISALSGQSTPVHASTNRFAITTRAEDIEHSLISELRDAVVRNTTDFVQNQFRPDQWDQSRRELVERTLKHHNNERWTEFPKNTSKTNVYNWIKKLEEDCFPDAPYKLSKCTTARQFANQRGQVDMFFHPTLPPLQASYNYGNVPVVAEHKTTFDRGRFKSVFSQLTRYARNIFAEEPTRFFVHGFSIQGEILEFWLFDRSGAFSSELLPIHEHPESVASALVAYATMTDEEMGKMHIIQSANNINYIELTTVEDETIQKFTVLHLIFKQCAVACRGTFCYSSPDGVVKLSWRAENRKSELEFLLAARERNVKGVATIVAWREFASTADHRSRHNFNGSRMYGFRQAPTSTRSVGYSPLKRHRRDSSSVISSNSSSGQSSRGMGGEAESPSKRPKTLGQFLPGSEEFGPTTSSIPYIPRMLTAVLIQPTGRPISQYWSAVELLTALKDATRGHRSLYEAQILHRDISINNIIITKPTEANGNFTGMLIDLDMAKYVPAEDRPTPPGRRTGTVQFMAYAVLRGETHTYLHDLESFLYVLLWLCAETGWKLRPAGAHEQEPKDNFVQKWGEGTMEEIADEKRALMTDADKFDQLLNRFPSRLAALKRVCREIRFILQEATAHRRQPKHDVIYSKIDQAYEHALNLM